VHVVRAHTQLTCCFRHQLPETDGTYMRPCRRVKCTFDLNVGPHQSDPIVGRQTRTSNRRIIGVSASRTFNRSEDCGTRNAGADRCTRSRNGCCWFNFWGWTRTKHDQGASLVIAYETAFADDENVGPPHRRGKKDRQKETG